MSLFKTIFRFRVRHLIAGIGLLGLSDVVGLSQDSSMGGGPLTDFSLPVRSMEFRYVNEQITYYGFPEFVSSNPGSSGPPKLYSTLTWNGTVGEFNSGPSYIGGSRTVFSGTDVWNGSTTQNNLSAVEFINLGSTSAGDGSNGPVTVVGDGGGGCYELHNGQNVTRTVGGSPGDIGAILSQANPSMVATPTVRTYNGAVGVRWDKIALPCNLFDFGTFSTDFPVRGPVTETLSNLVTKPGADTSDVSAWRSTGSATAYRSWIATANGFQVSDIGVEFRVYFQGCGSHAIAIVQVGTNGNVPAQQYAVRVEMQPTTDGGYTGSIPARPITLTGDMIGDLPEAVFDESANSTDYSTVVVLVGVHQDSTVSGCSMGCSNDAGNQNGQLGSIDWSMSLGTLSNRASAGMLLLHKEAFSPAVYTPAGLSIIRPAYGNDSLVQVRRPDQSLRQVSTGSNVYDIVSPAEDATLHATSYEIRYYRQDATTASTDGSGLMVPAGTPIQRTRFSDPVGDGQHLLIERYSTGSQPFSSIQYSFDSATSTWSLLEQGMRRTDKTTVSLSGGTQQVTTTVWDLTQTSPQLNSKVVENFQILTGNDGMKLRLLNRRTIDPDGAALVSQWVFDASNGRVISHQNYTGAWEKYQYGVYGTGTVATFTPIGNTLFGDSTGTTRLVMDNPFDPRGKVRYDNYSGLWTTTVDLGQVARAGVNYSATEQTRSIDGTYQMPANPRWEILQTYSGGPFAGRVSYHLDRAGVLELTTYSLDPVTNRTTQTMDHGAPSSDLSSVTDGTRTVTVTNPDGQLYSETVIDIASGLVTATQTVMAWDPQGRPTSIALTDGTIEQRTYNDCCGLLESLTRHGVTTTYGYDALRRRISETTAGISTIYSYDALDRVVKTAQVGTDNSQIVLATTTYDTGGRVIGTTNALGAATTYAEIYNADGTVTRTTVAPDQSTVVTVTNIDGTLQSRTGTQTAPVNYTYAKGTYASLPVQITTENRTQPGAVGTEWTQTNVDALGRTLAVQYPDGAAQTLHYNDLDQLDSQTDPDGVTTLFAYNAKNELETQAVDMDHNGQIDYGGTDVINRIHRDVTTDHNTTVFRSTTTVWTTNGGTASADVSVSESSADGLQSWQTINGLTTASQIAYNVDGSRTQTTTGPDGTSNVQSFVSNRLTLSTTSNPATGTLASTVYDYDSQGRVQTATDARNGATSYTYFNDGQVNTVTTPDPDPGRSGTGYDPQTTTYVYDNMGRVTLVTQPDGGQVNTTYWPTGAVRRTWGARTYPVEYTYDPQGRVKTLTTWQDFAGQSRSAVTTWNYDPQRGWLSSKTDAAGKSVSYTYTPAGRVLTRYWARETVRPTTYTHDAAGNVNSVTYSDQTPAVVLGYDRLGRLASRSDAGGVCTYAYQGATSLVTGESCSGGLLDGLSVGHGYDSLLRLGSVSALSTSSVLHSVSYAYDAASRLSTVTQGTNQAIYSFLPNSSLVGGIVFQQGGVSRLGTAMTYDYFNRLGSVTSTPSASTALAASYTYNSANQRTKVVREDNAYWNFGYDALGQVTSGSKFDATATAVLGHAFAYGFDDIGNRKSTTVNGQTATYSPNSLNQYTQRSVPGIAEVLGDADAAAVIMANSGPVSRQGTLFYQQLPVDNSSAKYLTVAVHGVRAGAGVTVDETRHAFVAQTPEAFNYDADGNLTADGKWTYEWDAENRLAAMQSTAGAVSAGAPKRRLVFSYDSLGRRIAKRVLGWDAATSAWGVQSSRLFLYDGWNLLAELDALNNNAVVSTQAWGLDLSGSMQGAGGVGGLLFTAMNLSTQPVTYASAYDGNGNTIGLVDMATGQQAATYEYGAFGEMLTSSGVAAAANHFGFSTKYTDVESGLSYYGLRYYSPSTGRWLSRDPIEEQGGLNVYGFVENDSINRYDLFGLWDGPGHFDTPYALAVGLGMSPANAERVAYLAEYFDINGNYSATKAKIGVVLEIRKYLHSLTGGDAAKLRAYYECLFKSAELTQDEKSMLLHPYGDTWPHSTQQSNGQEKLDGPLFGHLFRGHKADYISGNQEKYGRYVDSVYDVMQQIDPDLSPNPLVKDDLKNAAKNLRKPGFLSFFKNRKQDEDEAKAIRRVSGYNGGFHPEDPGQEVDPSIVPEQEAIGIANSLLNKIKKGVAGCCPPK